MALFLSFSKAVFSLMPEISLFEIHLFGLNIYSLLFPLFEKELTLYVSKCMALHSETDMSSDLNVTAYEQSDLGELAYQLCVSSVSPLKPTS